jgi:hypothetical protein
MGAELEKQNEKKLTIKSKNNPKCKCTECQCNKTETK